MQARANDTDSSIPTIIRELIDAEFSGRRKKPTKEHSAMADMVAGMCEASPAEADDLLAWMSAPGNATAFGRRVASVVKA